MKNRNGAPPIECVHLQTKPTTLLLLLRRGLKTISSFIVFYFFVCLFFWICKTPNLTDPSSPEPSTSVAPPRGDAAVEVDSMISPRDPDALFSGGGIRFPDHLTFDLFREPIWVFFIVDFVFLRCSFLAGTRPVKFSYGYSTLKGKRSTMEDFFETRISDVNGQMVAFFGVFDGMLFRHITLSLSLSVSSSWFLMFRWFRSRWSKNCRIS